MRNIYILLICIIQLTWFGALAQDDGGVSIGKGNVPANSKAILELYSDSKGLLIPRLTTGQREMMFARSDQSAQGLLVFDKDENLFYFWNGNDWESVGSSLTDGDVKLKLEDGKIYIGVDGEATQVAKSEIPISDFGAANSSISMEGNRITEVAYPLTNTDAVNKEYVDEVTGGKQGVQYLSLDADQNLSITGGNNVSLADLYQSLSLNGTILSISGPRTSHVDLKGIWVDGGSDGDSGPFFIAHNGTLTGDGSSLNPLGIAVNSISPSLLRGHAGGLSTGTAGNVLQSNGDGTFSWRNLSDGLPADPSALALPSGQFFVGDNSDKAVGTRKNNIPLSGFGFPETNVSMGGHRMTDLANPSDSRDAATKEYVDGLIGQGGGAPTLSLDADQNLSILGGNTVSLADLYQSLSLDGNILSISGPRESHIDLGAIFNDGGSGSASVVHDGTLQGDGTSANPLGIASNAVGTSGLKGSFGALDNGATGYVLQSNGNGTFSWKDLSSGVPADPSSLVLGEGQFFVGNTSGKAEATDKNTIPLSGFGDAAASISMGGFTIADLGFPVNEGDAASKKYVDDQLLAIPEASASSAGLMSSGDKVKLDAITGTNTGDQTLSLTGSELSISNGNSVDLSVLGGGGSSITSVTAGSGLEGGGITGDLTLGFAAVNDQTILGNNSGVSAAPYALTGTDLKSILALTKADVGLDQVDNTNDADKPVSSATQTELDKKLDKNPAITGATKTKITYDSNGLVTAGEDATTADIAPSTDRNYVTDDQLTTIGQTSGINTGDQDLTPYALKTDVLLEVQHDATLSGAGTTASPLGVASNVIDPSKMKGSGGALANGASGHILQSNGDGTFSWMDISDGVAADPSSLALGEGQFYVGNSLGKAAATSKNAIPLSGFGAAKDHVSMGGFNLTGLATPINEGDAASKKYVDDQLLAIPEASASNAGLMSSGDKVKLDDITGTNTGDQTLSLTGSELSISNGNSVSLSDLGGSSITSVTAGAGLEGGGTTGDISLSFAAVNDQTILGNNSGASAAPYALSGTDLKSILALTKADVGLDQVDNTSDAEKPVSSATQTELDKKLDKNPAITGATKTKITYDSNGLVTAGEDATTADIAPSTDRNYVTDDQLTTIGQTSGINTGDQDLTPYALKTDVLLEVQHDATLSGAGTTASPLGVASNVIDPSKMKGSGGALANGASGHILQSNGDGTFSWMDISDGVAADPSSLALGEGQFYVGNSLGKAAATSKNAIPLSGFGAAKDHVSMGGFNLTGLATPVNDLDAATKKYVDDHSASLVHTHSMTDLSDTELATKQNKDLLQWDGGTSKWVNRSVNDAIPEVSTGNAGLMTAADKAKLDGIATGANNYTLPRATSTALGGVKVGANLTIDADGILSAVGGGSGTVTNVSVTPANGVSGSVSNATTTPAISLTLGDITPTSVTTGDISATTITATGDITTSGNINGNVGMDNLTGVLPVAKGGTGVTNLNTLKVNLGLDQVDNTSDLNKPVSLATQTALDKKINLTEKGAASGVVPLNTSGKIDEKYLPASLVGDVSFMGAYNAATNTPALPDPSSSKGSYYITSEAGTNSSYSLTLNTGDWVLSDGATWSKISRGSEVASFNGRTGAIVSEAGDYNSDQVTEGSTNLYYTDDRVSNNTTVKGKEDVANKSTDGSLSSNSDILYPTVQATKTYIDSKIPAYSTTDANKVLQVNGTGTATEWVENSGSASSITLSGDVMGAGSGTISTSISNDAITSDKIFDGTILTEDLANQSVTAAKLAGLAGNGTSGQVLTSTGTGGFTWQGSSVTNLSYTTSATDGTVVNSAGDDAVIPAATNAAAGLMEATDKAKLDKIADLEGAADANKVLTANADGTAAVWKTPAAGGAPVIYEGTVEDGFSFMARGFGDLSAVTCEVNTNIEPGAPGFIVSIPEGTYLEFIQINLTSPSVLGNLANDGVALKIIDTNKVSNNSSASFMLPRLDLMILNKNQPAGMDLYSYYKIAIGNLEVKNIGDGILTLWIDAMGIEGGVGTVPGGGPGFSLSVNF
ncbi:head fiber protein [Sunxiuqinia elliptica]